MGLTYSWRSPQPDAFDSSVICLRHGIEFVSIDTLLDLDVLLNVNETLFHAFLWSELQDLLVAVCSLALDILASWLESEFPRTFYSCLVL